MYADGSGAIVAFAVVFYFLFIGLWWFICGLGGHMILKKKGYHHAGLYVLAWVPVFNWMTIFLFIGLPDALLNRKVDYLLRQMAASGLIQTNPMPQTARMPPQGQTGPINPAAQVVPPASPTPGQTNVFNAQAAQPTQTAHPAQVAQPNPQAMWQPSQSQQNVSPITPENLFGPGSNPNNNNEPNK